jgi:hypothetical protein
LSIVVTTYSEEASIPIHQLGSQPYRLPPTLSIGFFGTICLDTSEALLSLCYLYCQDLPGSLNEKLHNPSKKDPVLIFFDTGPFLRYYSNPKKRPSVG